MIQTVNFKTRTVIYNRKNPCKNDKFYPIGMDIGYSGVKLLSPNKAACFPYYALKMPEGIIQFSEASKTDIQYRDETGTWYIGELAQVMTDRDNTNENMATMYGRQRYPSPMFKVIARAGIGLGMLANNFGSPEGKTIVLQTGLPPAYAKSDAPLLRKALAGSHKFELKVGTGEWVKYEFDLPNENINIMAQPLGSLVSFTTDENGRRIPDYAKYLNNNVNILIDDAGFGTADWFDVKNGRVSDIPYTRDDLGMKRVFDETSREFYKRYGVEMPIHTMQNYLQKGEYPIFNIDTMSQEMISFADILEEMNKKVCMESIEYVKSTFNYLKNYQYYLITGGTGAARFNIIKEHFSKMTTLKVISANANDTLPQVFSNARGYYYNLVRMLEKVA